LLLLPVVPAFELWGSGSSGWKDWDLNLLNGSSLIFSDMPVAAAHKHGIGWFTTCGPAPADMANEASRAAFAAACAHDVSAAGADGANFDYEDPIAFGDPLVQNYTLTVAATSAALKQASLSRASPLQVVVDIAWAPNGIDGRFYDAKGLADAADRLFVMDYDMQSQIFGRCVAQANSPYQLVKRGLEQFLQLGVPAKKLVLATPWYGYSYECAEGTPDTADVCQIAERPWRGINCSDAVGTQFSHRDVMQILDSKANCTEVRWDDNLLAPYFNYRTNGTVNQVWFDNPRSLALKYRLAKELGLAGVGVWTFGEVAPLPDMHARGMWDALREALMG
jgi:di-N-acetylchitobiase